MSHDDDVSSTGPVADDARDDAQAPNASSDAATVPMGHAAAAVTSPDTLVAVPPGSDALAAMAARVQARAEEEGAGSSEPEKPALTDSFVAKCSKYAEKGDGILHSAMFQGRLVYVPETKTWYEWAAHYWEKTHIHRVEASVEEVGAKYREVAEAYRKKSQQADDADEKSEGKILKSIADRLERRAANLNSVKGITACLKCTLNCQAPLIASPDIWDTDPWLISVFNGVVDLKTGELRPGRPNDYIRKSCPVEWKGLHHPAPSWERFLQEIIGAADGVLPYLHKTLGYAITGNANENIFLMLYGEQGRNGKTIFMETIKRALGPYMGPMKAELLLERNIPKDPDSATPTIMNMNGMRIMYAAETSENRRFSTAQVKWLSGSDMLTGRYLWDKEDTEFSPTHTLFLLTNFMPGATAHDSAFWERLRLINFPFRFVENPKGDMERPRDIKLFDKLLEELPGVLAWLVRGCLLYRKEGLKAPPAVLKSIEDYRTEQDTMQVFVDMCLQKASVEDRLSASEIYEVYREWHKHNVHPDPRRVPNMNVFGRQLKTKVEKRKVGGLYWYYGVRWSEGADKYASRAGPKDSPGP